MADPLDAEGPVAPPRDNGELVFDAPWQSRAFAVVVALHESGLITWDEFRGRLVAELATTPDAGPDRYWAAWLRAAEAVLAARGLVTAEQHAARLTRYAAREPGHDHDHGHGHGHGHPVHPRGR